MSKARIAGFIIGLLAGVMAVVGCGVNLEGDRKSIVPTSASASEVYFTTSTTYTPPPTQKVPVADGEDAEDLYVHLLEMSEISLSSQEAVDEAIKTGWALCRAFDNSAVTYEMLLESVTARQTFYSDYDVENIIYSAVMSLCPEHSDELP